VALWPARASATSLALENGEPADPAVFLTAVSDWRVRQMSFTGDGTWFRILALEPEMDEERSRETMGLFVVEPVGDALET
jgi:hypothetical protein